MSISLPQEESLYDLISKVTLTLRDRLEREEDRSASLHLQAEVAKRQASETRTAYEALAKLHEAMANQPAEAPQPYVAGNVTRATGGTVVVGDYPFGVTTETARNTARWP